jgi:uncharacterized protein (TIGR04255 family)
MDDHLPEFDAPPVIETVIGVQFQPLADYTTAHAGWFWRQHLDRADWPKVIETEPLQDQFELFGDEKKWGMPVFQIRMGAAPDRTQFVRKDDERLIQLQKTRFIYNWRKRTCDYPRYRKLLPEFDTQFENFAAFVREVDLGEVNLNQWEMTYVNHILKGELWNSPEDWPNVIPKLYVPPRCLPDTAIDSLAAEWSLGLPQNRGRLHVSLKHGRLRSATGPEALILQLTARGPLAAIQDLHGNLELAHESIVRSFAGMTSETAHRHWKRRS